MDRRDFLKTTAGAALMAPAVVTKGFGSANERVRVAVVGMHQQGGEHIKSYIEMADVELAALCDIDETVLAQRLKELEPKGVKPKTYTDVRELLKDKSIDAISIATPNHWHTLAAVWGLQAGKDVYVEKPCCHNIWEGQQLVAAAKKYNRIVQHGTNARSATGVREAMEKLHEGVIGDVYMARGLCFKWRDTIGRKPDGPVPAGVHYDLWTGPAHKRPFNPNRFHYNWHWNWEYGNGDIGNQGIHQMDVARWGLGVKFPTRVEAMGGHFMFDDDQETPNTLVTTAEFNDGGKKKMLVFEVRHWITNHEAGIAEGNLDDRPPNSNGIGDLFYGSKGYMAVGFGGYKTFLGRRQEPGPTRVTDEGNNWRNFIDAVKSRKPEDRNAPIEEGYISTVLVHLANISYRTGRAINFDPNTQQIVGDKEAQQYMTREYRHPFVVPKIT